MDDGDFMAALSRALQEAEQSDEDRGGTEADEEISAETEPGSMDKPEESAS